LTILSVWALICVPRVAGAQIQPVLLKNASGPDPGSLVKKFRGPQLSDATGERIAFVGRVRRPITGGTVGVYRVDFSGMSSIVAERGDPALDSKFRNFRRPAINNAGEVSWFAFLYDGIDAIFRRNGTGPGDPLIPVVSTQMASPVGGVFTDLGDPQFSPSGGVYFWGETSDPSAPQGIFRCEGGNQSCLIPGGTGVLSTVIKVGDPLADRPGLVMCSIADPISSSSFGLAFRGSTKAGGCASAGADAEGIFRADSAAVPTITTIALQGEPSSLDVGSFYDRFRRSTPSIENDGMVAFRANVSGSANTEGVFVCNPVSCPASPAQTIVQKDDPDPSGSLMRRFADVQIADNGDVLFQAKPKGGGTSKGPTLYFHRSGGALERVVTKEDTVGGLPGATVKRAGSSSLSPAGTLVLNAKLRNSPAGNSGFFRFP